MGDTPEIIPNDQSCPAGPYPGGVQPAYVIVHISGCEKTETAPPLQREPINGTFILEFVTCGSYSVNYGVWDLFLFLQSDHGEFKVQLDGSVWCYYFEFEYPIEQTKEGVLISLVAPYTDGDVSIELQKYGYYKNESWANASLVGVPAVDGYFAEPMPVNNYDESVRYASHLDGTNIRLYMNH